MDKRFLAVMRELQALVARKNGEDTLRFYHGPKHSGMVLGYVIVLAELALCSETEIEDLARAAAGHDLEQKLGPEKNEMESMRLIGGCMRRHGYSEEEIKRTTSLVPGTIVYWVDGEMHQRAENMNHLSQILADADLSALGARGDDFADMALRLMAEFAKKPISEFTKEEVIAGWKNQVKFMTGRRYLTTEAEFLFRNNFIMNLAYARRMAGM